jgi:hypothetical protein
MKFNESQLTIQVSETRKYKCLRRENIPDLF